MVNLSKHNEYEDLSMQWHTERVKANCRRDIREHNDLGALAQLLRIENNGGVA